MFTAREDVAVRGGDIAGGVELEAVLGHGGVGDGARVEARPEPFNIDIVDISRLDMVPNPASAPGLSSPSSRCSSISTRPCDTSSTPTSPASFCRYCIDM